MGGTRIGRAVNRHGRAPGWDPTHASGPSETPGTVFITNHANIETVWVVETIDRAAHTSVNSRATPGHHAGTVRARYDDQPDSHCVVSVGYDMTELTPDHAQVLDAYNDSDEHFEALIKEWATIITATCVPVERGLARWSGRLSLPPGSSAALS